MNDAKYIGLDVHQTTVSATVLDSTGKLVMESILETKAATILQFIDGVRGSLHVTFEEGTCAAWLHDLLKPHATQVLVCDPRKNALLKVGNKSDRIDSRKLADVAIRGLNKNHNHDLKNILKGAAIRAAAVAGPVAGPFQEFYAALVAKGMKPAMARLTLARKIAAITLIVWKKGVHFDAAHLKQQAA